LHHSLVACIVCYVQLQSVGIEVLEQTERQLTVDEVKEFFASRSEEVSI
jgi:hypothetical protein